MATIELGPFEFADKIPLKRDYQASRGAGGARARRRGSGSFLDRGRGDDAELRQHRRPGRARTRWSTPGPRSARAPRSAPTSTSRAASASAACSNRRRRSPVIVGDDCLIGSRCIVAEGARVGDGVVLGAGCILTGSIPVIDAETGEELGRGDRAAVVRRGLGHAAPHVPRRRVRPAVRARHQATRAGRAPRQGASSTTSCATTAPRPDALDHATRPARAHRRAGRHPVGEPRRGGASSARLERELRARAVARGRPRRRQPRRPHQPRPAAAPGARPATPTPCRPTATTAPASTATRCGASGRPT